MALQKEIELDNGVVLNYHRITSLNKITNISNTIEVNSYISEKQREKEQQYQELQKQMQQLQEEKKQENLTEEQNETLSEQEHELQEELNKGINVLVEADFIQIPYNANMTIDDAYDYLKTTDKYKNAKKV